MARLVKSLRATAYWAEDQFDWLFSNPVFPAQIVFMLLAAWGLVGAELGIERLFWSESWFVQLSCGFAVGMLFGVVLFVWYLLDRPQRAVVFLAQPGSLTLFPSRTDRRVRRIGAYLFWALPALLLVLVAGKLAVVTAMAVTANPSDRFPWGEYFRGRLFLAFGMAGYLLVLVLAWLLFLIDDRLGIREAITRRRWFRNQPGFASGRVPRSEMALHAVSMYLVVVSVVFLAGAIGLLLWQNANQPGHVLASPVVLVCLVFILLTQLYGYWSCHVQLGTLTLAVIVVGLVVWNAASVFPEVAYKDRFPGLDEYYDHPNRVRLAELDTDGRPPGVRGLPDSRELLQDADILAAIDTRWQQQSKQPDTRPKIVLVAVSGGGIRSATWTTLMLEKLEQEMPAGVPNRAAFRNHIRLITGASGGMVGGTLYTADFDRDWSDRGTPAALLADKDIGLGLLSGIAANQSLLPTIQTAVMRDFSLNLLLPPGVPASYDRGRSLEDKWALNARDRGYGPTGKTAAELAAIRASGKRLSPFNRTFADLYEHERQGLRPSLIYSPMLVEDSRRLLISNLDLGRLAVATGPVVHTPDEGVSRVDGQYSRSGLEFFKLFPKAHTQFQVGTAARMSATFPVISPAVSLPTVPPRRVVDAGYFDNYGVDLAAMWLLQNRAALREHVGGVALVEIRAFPLQNRGLAFEAGDPAQREAGGILADAMATVSTPLRAVLRARGNAAYHRNNELLAALDYAFNTSVPKDQLVFRRFVFELDTDAALNWYLSTEEKKRIVGRADTEAIKNQAKALAEWLGDGGGPRW